MADYLKLIDRPPQWLSHPSHPQWQATAGQVKVLFGLRENEEWPPEGMPKREIQGFICWVDPITEGKFKIRAKMFCGLCGDETPIGRMKQHIKKHKY